MLLKIAGSIVTATLDVKFPTGNRIAVIFFSRGAVVKFLLIRASLRWFSLLSFGFSDIMSLSTLDDINAFHVEVLIGTCECLQRFNAARHHSPNHSVSDQIPSPDWIPISFQMFTFEKDIREVTIDVSLSLLQPHFVAEKSCKSTHGPLDQSTVFNHSKLSSPSSNPTSNIGSYGKPFSNPFASPFDS
jgi:hypothetical protein